MHYFEVPKLWSIHSNSIGTKMMFGSVSGHFTNHRHVKRCFGPECTISVYRSCEASILLHWTQNDVCECFRAFRYPSVRKKWKTCVCAWMHYFEVPKLWSTHSSPLDPKWYLGVFQSISPTFGNKKDAKLVFRAWMHYLEVPRLRSIHSTPLEPKWCLDVFQSISLTFGT
jgi:hypothetical protein